jgi:SAM-dependent methyltransferase
MEAAAMDEAKLEQFMGQAVGDLGAAISGLMVYIGDQLGLYRAMAGAGAMTPRQLAEATGTDARYVAEWLNNQAAGGYVTYDPASRAYELPEEQALALADEDSPVFLPGGFVGIASAWADSERFVDAFRTGNGVGWHEHDPRLFRGTERFFRPGYKAHLVPEWIPALEGVQDKLEKGGKVADVGCGHGASTVLMAQAFPNSSFTGFDYHEPSIEAARQRAAAAGVGDRTNFEVARAKDFPGSGYDMVAFFDCLHDMGDPVGAAAHTREALADDGTVMLVEPFAGDRPEDNHTPVGRAFYGFSTVICTMASKAQEVGVALGAQAGEAQLREIFEQAGFSRFRRATETPFNLILEAKP